MNQTTQKSPPPLPDSYLVGRGELFEWLERWGIKSGAARKLIETNTIKPRPIGKLHQRKYCPSEIVEDLGLYPCQPNTPNSQRA